MSLRNPTWILALVIAGVAGGTLSMQMNAQAPAAGSAAPAAGDREPGLYWTIQTEMGNIACKLFETESPVTVRQMVGLAVGKISYVDPKTKATTKKKFFDGLTFHRVIPGFMIQGGDPLGTGVGGPEGPGFPYKNENSPNLKFDVPGRLAMANAGPNTNASQFFVTEVANPGLNGGYTIWGQCQNPEVVKAIARVKRDASDKPLTPVHMLHVVVERVGPAPANAPEAMPAARTAPAPKAGTAAPKAGTAAPKAGAGAPKAPATAPKSAAPSTAPKKPATPATK
jgi:peptidyl-prolyl cis-trans isomerase A (cyclophilin A)